MTSGPEQPAQPPPDEPTQPFATEPPTVGGASGPPPTAPPPSWGQPGQSGPYAQSGAYAQAPQGPYPPQPYGQPAYGYPGAVPGAPYGVHPMTGIPYSDKSKIIAGILQIVLPLGIGRFYLGDTGLGVAQLLVTIFTCGIGSLWPLIDGIIILATDSKDSRGLMLRS